MALDCTDFHRNQVALEVVFKSKLIDAGTQELEPALAVLVGALPCGRLLQNPRSTYKSLSMGVLEQFAMPLQTLLMRVAKSENLLSTRMHLTRLSTSDAPIISSSYATPLKRMPGTSSPSALMTIVYPYSGRWSSIQYKRMYPLLGWARRQPRPVHT